MTDQDLRQTMLHNLKYRLGKDAEHASIYDWRMALSMAILPAAFIQCDPETGYLEINLDDWDIDWEDWEDWNVDVWYDY